MPASAPSRVDADELRRLEQDVAEQTPPGLEPPLQGDGTGAPAAELHDARTEPPPGSGEPTPDQVEALLAEPLTEEDLKDLLELAFALIAARRRTRDPVTGKLVWELAPDESARIAHWAAKVVNRRAWLKKLAEFFPEIMCAVTLLYAGWRRYEREEEILAAEQEAARRRAATVPTPGEEPHDNPDAASAP